MAINKFLVICHSTMGWISSKQEYNSTQRTRNLHCQYRRLADWWWQNYGAKHGSVKKLLDWNTFCLLLVMELLLGPFSGPKFWSEREEKMSFQCLIAFPFWMGWGHTMFQVVSHLPVTVEAWVQYQGSPLGVSDGQSGTRMGFSVRVSVFMSVLFYFKCHKLFVTSSFMAYQYYLKFCSYMLKSYPGHFGVTDYISSV
jgi:hypothetical protein